MTRLDRPDRLPLLGIGVALVGVVCCAGLPVLAAALAGVSIAAVAGVGLGGIVVIGLGAAALGVLRARRRTCEREEGQKGLTR